MHVRRPSDESISTWDGNETKTDTSVPVKTSMLARAISSRGVWMRTLFLMMCTLVTYGAYTQTWGSRFAGLLLEVSSGVRPVGLAGAGCLHLVTNLTEFANFAVDKDELRYDTYQSAEGACRRSKTCTGIVLTLPHKKGQGQKVSMFHLLRFLKDSFLGFHDTTPNTDQYVWRRERCAPDEKSEMQRPSLPATGYKVRGRDTIFVQATTYRDPDCHLPILTGLQRAKHPERIFFGILYQVNPNDMDCSLPPVNCTDVPEHVMCKYRNNIVFKRTDAREGKGPTYARHLADQLYGNQTFIVQIDGHMSFTNNWDEVAIDQWRAVHNEMAVLSTYPCEVNGCVDEFGNSTCAKPSMICTSSAQDPSRTFRHHGAGILSWKPTVPLLNPFLGAGLVFSKGHRVINVPNDCCTPWVFDGEEFVLGARLLSHGYDIYTPATEFAFHPYERKHVKKFWDQMRLTGRGTRDLTDPSVNRMRKILGQQITRPYNNESFAKYSLSTQRNFDKILTVYGINLSTGQVSNYCSLSYNGDTNARIAAFATPYGVDYSAIPDDIITRDALPPKGRHSNKKKHPRLK